MSKFTEEQLRTIEQQLRCPSGAMGVEMGERMNHFNSEMTNSTIDALDLKDKEIVLELGHGNGGHINHLLQQANNIHYHGVDISETMHEQAKNNTQELSKTQQITFQLYNGTQLPFEDNFFYKIMTVNTIYFWTDPSQLMQEIGRVLQPSGRAIITFAHRNYLEKAPTVGDLFTIVDKEDIEQLAQAAQLKVVKFADLHDQIENSAQEMVRRDFCLAVLTKH